MTIPSGARLGAYEVLEPLGAGGMGEVYRARDSRLGREVALKVLPETLAADRDRIARFEQEARAASALNHPNIVTIHEIGREGETAFIAMELVDGKTLRDLTASGALPVRRILGIAAQIAEGLAKAHGAGIVHRDLKPENVMVSKDGFVKILDFGLAKLVEPESGEVSAMPTLAQPETRPGTVMGTVAYMSPEQASGEPTDFRSDQFSFGSMLYEMATGQKAFQRKTAAETMSAIIRDEPEPVAKLRPELPLPVRWMLERCLAKDREERYASTRDLARDLAGVRDHISEVTSSAEATLASPGKSRRRMLPLAAALGLLAIGLAAGWALTRGLSKSPPGAPLFRRLTFRRGTLGNARFTPDGQAIVYSATWDGVAGGTRLYLTRPESPESQVFDFGGSVDMLSISRTGELALLQNQTPSVGTFVGTLAVAPLTGGVPRKLVEDVSFGGADWAPDGKGIAVVRMVQRAGRLEFPVGKVLVAGGVRCPRFARGGDTIAFFEDGPESSSVAIVDPNGKSKKLLSSGWGSLQGVPAWTPDGREVWFTAAQEGGQRNALWAVDRSGKRRLILRVPGELELYDIARDGRVLLAHHTIVRRLLGLGAGQSKELDLSWLDSSWPADVSPDGKTLLITEDGEGGGSMPSIYLRGTDGSPAVRLGDGEGLAISPDGKWALGIRSKPEGLVLLPTGAGPSRALDGGGLKDFLWGGWLPDGGGIVFSAGADRQRIYVQNVPEGKPHDISPPGVRVFPYTNPVSPDGKHVVGAAGRKFAIYSIDGAGEPRALDELSLEDIPIQWSSDSSSLYITRKGEQPTRIWRLDLATGQRQLWKELPADVDQQGIRVRLTPDGKSYVRGGTSVLSELYFVEGLR